MRKCRYFVALLIAFALFNQFAPTLLSVGLSNAEEYVFSTKRIGLTPNIPTAKNGYYENWNIARLGLLDRLELTIEQSFASFAEFNDFDYSSLKTINLTGLIPTFKYGTIGLGYGVIEDDLNIGSLAYPYIAYSRNIGSHFLFGMAYSIELPQDNMGKLDNNGYIMENSFEQLGLIIRPLDYIHLGVNIENRGYLRDIESIRPSIAFVLTDVMSPLKAFTIGADLDFSLSDISAFESSKYNLYNAHLSMGFESKYISLECGVFQDYDGKGDQTKGLICFNLTLPFDSNNPIDLNYSALSALYKNQKSLAQKLNLTIGESKKGKLYMEKAIEYESNNQMNEAISYLDKSNEYLIGDRNKDRVNSLKIKIRNSIEKNTQHYNKGIKFMNEGLLDDAVKELNQIPYWDAHRESAKSNLSKLTRLIERRNRLENLYSNATVSYSNRNFDVAYRLFDEILSIEPSFKDANKKRQICKQIIGAYTLYNDQEYDSVIEECNAIIKNYKDEALVAVLLGKSRGHIEYNKGEYQKAIDFWKNAQKLDKEAGLTQDADIEKMLLNANSQIAMKKRLAENLFSEAKSNYDNGRYESAEKSCMECLDIDPNYNKAKDLLIIIYKDLLSNVKSSYTAAITDPTGNILNNDIKPNLQLISKARHIHSKDLAEAYMYMGAIQVAFEKNNDSGEKMFVKALETYPSLELTKDIDDNDIIKVFNSALWKKKLR